MHKLGEQWIEVIDGQEHMVKAVKTTVYPPCGLCVYRHGYQCTYPSWLGECDKYAIKDLGILHAGLLPCPFCGEYPTLKEELDENDERIYAVEHECNIDMTTGLNHDRQTLIDAWNRRE